jgi:hypothetical protein
MNYDLLVLFDVIVHTQMIVRLETRKECLDYVRTYARNINYSTTASTALST